MQRVSAFLPAWDKRNSGPGKPAGLFAWSHRNSNTPKLPSKINIAAANGDRVHREAYWPTSLDVECDKAARILKSFCTDGYLAPDDDAAAPAAEPSSADPPPSPARVTKKIPKRIIQNAAGIAVFSCMRSGLWMTGSGGSGILIARKSDGTWSPPSGILLHTPTLSFIIGVDIYDCVLVINNLAALESITRPRVTLGEDVGLTNGPSVSLDSDEVHINWRELGNTVLAYMKARGQHQAVNLHGCILAERANENERFYDGPITQMDVLAGNVARCVQETRPLFEVIKMAEGRTDFDAAVIDSIAFQSAPGDAVIATPRSTSASPRPSFGIPKADDPDPYGVLALEMAGLEIREAGTRLRPTSSQFEFNPAPLSPSLSKFSRQSVETFATRSNRASVMSSRTVKSQVTDACTQTDVANTPDTTASPGQSDDGQGQGHTSTERMPEVKEEVEVDYTRVDLAPLRNLSQEYPIDVIVVPASASAAAPAVVPAWARAEEAEEATSADGKDQDEEETNDADDEDDLDDDVEEPVVFEVAAVQPASTRAIASRVIHAKGNVVTIPKRLPPPLPKRSPARNSGSGKSEAGAEILSVPSPLRQTFDDADPEAEGGDEAVLTSDDNSHGAKGPERVEGENGPGEAGKTPQEQGSVQEAGAEEEKPEGDESSVEKSGAVLKGKHGQTGLTIETTGVAGIRAPNKTEGTHNDENNREAQDVPAPQAAVEKSEGGEDGVQAHNAIPHEQTDNSDSTTHKHTSSIYTGATEDRWSCDGSSLTTPTSERRDSMSIGGEKEGETPTRVIVEEAEGKEREKRPVETAARASTQPTSEPNKTNLGTAAVVEKTLLTTT
ncbi:hypothetical protein CDD83_880 [Cordyceps sp. RAO-2017]|nr:hypothetical protein CDD83_880 [Cordyceps sp. RAO-2017]